MELNVSAISTHIYKYLQTIEIYKNEDSFCKNVENNLIRFTQ